MVRLVPAFTIEQAVQQRSPAGTDERARHRLRTHVRIEAWAVICPERHAIPRRRLQNLETCRRRLRVQPAIRTMRCHVGDCAGVIPTDNISSKSIDRPCPRV
jgi:hypothetical protein